jgi:hypothetical protein
MDIGRTFPFAVRCCYILQPWRLFVAHETQASLDALGLQNFFFKKLYEVRSVGNNFLVKFYQVKSLVELIGIDL